MTKLNFSCFRGVRTTSVVVLVLWAVVWDRCIAVRVLVTLMFSSERFSVELFQVNFEHRF